MKMPFTSSQIIAGVLGAGVLLAGAFAVGRASAPAAPDAAVEAAVTAGQQSAQAPAQPPAQGSNPPTPAPKATAAEPRAANSGKPQEGGNRMAATASSPALCGECARVVEVHEETRQGKASGLGAVGGALVGGLLGNQVGGGNGKKLATIGGAVAGGYAGNEIEKRQKSHRVWVVRVSHADGSTQRLEQAQDPGLRVGDVVVVRDGRIERRRD